MPYIFQHINSITITPDNGRLTVPLTCLSLYIPHWLHRILYVHMFTDIYIYVPAKLAYSLRIYPLVDIQLYPVVNLIFRILPNKSSNMDFPYVEQRVPRYQKIFHDWDFLRCLVLDADLSL